MTDDKHDSLGRSLDELAMSLDAYDKLSTKAKNEKRLAFLALSKAFEVAVEYSWKELKAKVVDEGLDPQSPKATIRDAAQVGFIDNPGAWLVYINTRNAAVHDYFSLPEKEYVAVACEFLGNARKALSRA